MLKYHYVYRITNTQTNKHYYGVRSSKVEPKLDLGIKYFSSSTDKEFIKEQKENKSIFKYKIIKQFNSREEAVKLEIKLHSKFDVGLNESFYNRAKQTSTRFDTTGIKHTDEFREKNSVAQTGKTLSEEHKIKIAISNTITKKDPKIIEKFSGGNHGKSRKVLCLNNNEIFLTIKAAADSVNGNSVGVCRVCQGLRKHYKNFIFKYV